MLHQNFDSGLDGARMHHRVEHNRTFCPPIRHPGAGLKGIEFLWIRVPRGASDVMTSSG